MHAGYLQKRCSPVSPPQMQRLYCVLWGTMFLDFDSNEEAQNSVIPHAAVEIIGISEWDGVGRFNTYHNSFLIVTHTGCTYYLNAASLEEKNEWMLHIKCSLEFSFGNPNCLGFKPRKELSAMPSPSPAASSSTHKDKDRAESIAITCAKTNVPMPPSATVHYCSSCTRGFSSLDHISEPSTLLQCGAEGQVKMCADCKNAQSCVMWVKIINYIHAITLHRSSTSSTYIQDIRDRYASTFALQRKQSPRLDMAAMLLEQGSVTLQEFYELRPVE